MLEVANEADPQAPAILFINDTRDQSNWGSQALTDTLAEIFQESLRGRRFKFIPSYSMLAASAGYHGPDMLLPHVADEYEYVADEWLRGRGGPGADEIVAAMEGVTVAVFNAEGSVYRNNYSAIKGLFLLWLSKTRFNTRALFLNGGVHLTRVEPLLPAMVRKTFAVMDVVAVREPYSQRSLKELAGIDAQVIPDSAFYLTPDLAAKSGAWPEWQAKLAGGDYFCFSAGQMAFDYRYQKRSALYELIERLKTLVPQAVFLAKEPFDQFLEQVAKDTGSLFFGPQHTYLDLMAILANAKFQLSGRYHHLIMGSIVGCPSVPFAGLSHKIHGLCELLEGEIGTPYDSGDLRFCMPEILATVRRLLAEGPERRRRLQNIAGHLRTRLDLGELIRGDEKEALRD